MRNIDCIIIDDQPENITILVHFLNKYCPNINVVGKASTFDIGLELLNTKKCELVFLDIILDVGTGFDLLDKAYNPDVKVVVISSFREHALKAIKYNVIDYLLKPFDIRELKRLVAKLNLSPDIENEPQLKEAVIEDFIAVHTIDEIELIKYEDIVYLEADGRYTTFFLADNKKIVACKNIGEYGKNICNPNFFRIHKSFIVNFKYVKRISKVKGYFVEFVNELNALPIAKRKYKELCVNLNLR